MLIFDEGLATLTGAARSRPGPGRAHCEQGKLDLAALVPSPEHHERRAEAPLRPPTPAAPARASAPAAPARRRLLETRRPRLALAKRQERCTQVHLELSPVEWRPRMRHILERQPVVRRRLRQTARPRLALAKRRKRDTCVPRAATPARGSALPSPPERRRWHSAAPDRRRSPGHGRSIRGPQIPNRPRAPRDAPAAAAWPPVRAFRPHQWRASWFGPRPVVIAPCRAVAVASRNACTFGSVSGTARISCTSRPCSCAIRAKRSASFASSIGCSWRISRNRAMASTGKRLLRGTISCSRTNNTARSPAEGDAASFTSPASRSGGRPQRTAAGPRCPLHRANSWPPRGRRAAAAGPGRPHLLAVVGVA